MIYSLPHVKYSQEIIPGRLFFSSTHYPLGATEDDTDTTMYFSTDVTHAYMPFSEDFGPVNISVVHEYCDMVSALLEDEEYMNKEIHHCFSTTSPHHAANATVLMGAFCVLVLKHTPKEVKQRFAALMPSLPQFRDAGVGPSTWDLKVMHAIKGLHKGEQHGFYSRHSFCPEVYKFYEQVDHGDLNWIVPNKVLAFSGPHALPNGQSNGYSVKTPTDYRDYFRAYNVTDVVRLNKAEYDPEKFREQGISHHHMYFIDGSTPSIVIVEQFLHIMDNAKGVVAVHCKAGLGRTGTLVALWLMWAYDLKATEAIAWVRLCRPGSIMGPQQHFVAEREETMRKKIPTSAVSINKFKAAATGAKKIADATGGE
eukprot:CFRG7371T1